MNPFQEITYDNSVDLRLIDQAVNGSSQALEDLLKRHQHYIYNIALKMVVHPSDAADITQEVLIKITTKLSQFQGKSNFRTWLYRITFNHFLTMRQHRLEDHITTFAAYGKDLDDMPDVTLNEQERIEQKELIREVRVGCMSGMLLCLNREQRLVFVLGEIFEADHSIGSELLDISKANFRKRLERARHDLYQFMNHKCGLINQENPCRCARKTRGFIQAGWVDPAKLKFNSDYVLEIRETIGKKYQQLADLVEDDYADLFRKAPFQEKDHVARLMKRIVQDKKVRDTFNLN